MTFADITTFPCRFEKSTISPGNPRVFKQRAAQRDFSANELQSTNCSADQSLSHRCEVVKKGGEEAGRAS